MQRHLTRLQSWLSAWVDEAGTVVLTPSTFFTEHDAGYDHAVRFAVTAGVTGAVLQLLVLLVLTRLHVLPPPPHITALPTAAGPRLVTGLGGAIGGGVVAGTIGLFLVAGVLHLAVKLLGGTGFEKTVTVVGHAAAVSAVFGWLLGVTAVGAVITAGYWVWVTMEGLATVHGFSRMRATFAVLLPVLIGGVLVAAAVGAATLQVIAAF